MKSSPNPQNAPRIQTSLAYLDPVLIRALRLEVMADISAYDITSGVHTNAHEDAFSAPRTNVRLVAVFGAFKVPRVHSCALHLHYP